MSGQELYMQQRYYEPLAGRFLSVDPVTTDANTGGSFNRYDYANNSPYRYTDPDGRDPDSCGKGALFCYSTYVSESGSSVQSPQNSSVVLHSVWNLSAS
jgi:RHS repeat-associated protein